MSSNPRFRRTDKTLSSEIGEDVVALQLDRGFCYGMEQVTAAVWRLLEQPMDAPGLCERLEQMYEVSPDQCREEIGDLLEQMRDEGLIEIA